MAKRKRTGLIMIIKKNHIKLPKVYGITAIMFCMSLFLTNTKAQQMATINNSLSTKEKSIITISSLTAKGDLVKLKKELNTGLESGLTINEIKEVLVHLYAYCGFPRSIRGLQTFMEVLTERKVKGITDIAGKEASPVHQDTSKYQRGKKVLGELTQIPQPDKLSGYSAFAPVIDTFLKEHLFADIFERDVLSYAQRELVTISIIATIGNADPMLQGHLGISLNVGITSVQLQEWVRIIKSTAGKKEAKAAQIILDNVLNDRTSQ
jgi:alkylhydroperoxidase/carboxymuconolactone decarboxylase family protein YurZ